MLVGEREVGGNSCTVTQPNIVLSTSQITPPTFHFLTSDLIWGINWVSNMWENGPWPGKQERSCISNTIPKHQGPELLSSNIIDTGTSSHPDHGRVLQLSHTVHLSRWSPALAAYAARSPVTLQLGSQHCSRKTKPQVICHFYKMSPHTKIQKAVY